jgi:succinate-acetate transporter protein
MIKGNTFAGTAFFSYGAFWMAFFVMKFLIKSSSVLGGPKVYTSDFKVGETLIMVLWGVFTSCFFVPTLRKNGCLMFVFGSLAVTFFLLAGGQWSTACNTAAGYVGFVCGCSAIYTAFAEIWQESLGLNMPGLRPVRFI